MSARDLRILRDWDSGRSGPVPIRLLTTGDRRSGLFQAFCAEIAAAAPKIEIAAQMRATMELPALLVGESWRYHAIPRGNELGPFLKILSLSTGTEAKPEDAILEQFKRAPQEMDLKIFVAPECPFCPKLVELAAPLPLFHSSSRISIIDASLFRELADSERIKAVPTAVLNDRFRWTGQVELSAIFAALEHDNPSELEPEVFKGMLKEGQASRLAAMMLEKGEIFPGFMELLHHPEWSVRLGAMVVMEEIAEADKKLAWNILDPLWKMVQSGDESVKGDLVYLMGTVGTDDPRVWVERLECLIEKESNSELRDIIAEAISKLADNEPDVP